MARPVSSDASLPWDQEGDLEQARAQVVKRAEEQADARGSSDIVWLTANDPPSQLQALADRSVVVADLVLWDWTDDHLRQLADHIERWDGLLVFVEPTAGLGWRRAAQILGRRLFERRRGHHYQRDLPAELRAHGLMVGTQVRLQQRWAGDYVRGEARHIPSRPTAPISE